jgi:preprotein translocase subunit SecD
MPRSTVQRVVFANILAFSGLACAEQTDVHTTRLSFHVVSEESSDYSVLQTASETGETPEGTLYFVGANDEPAIGYIVDAESTITQECMSHISIGEHHYLAEQSVLNFRFDSECAQRFAKMTEENVGRQFAVVLNDKVISAPTIRTPIIGGAGFIEGGWDEGELMALIDGFPDHVIRESETH